MKVKTTLTAYRAMDRAGLQAKVSEMRERLMKLNFKKASGQMENTAQLKTIRRDIARALNVIAEKREGV